MTSMWTRKEDRHEFCQRLQDDFEKFSAKFWERKSLPAPRVTPLYPAHRNWPTARDRSGWRVSFYCGRGYVGRAYPTVSNTGSPSVNDFSLNELRKRWDARCGHECRPIPHPECGCGVWASETAADASVQLRGALLRPHWFSKYTDAGSRFIAYPVRLETVRILRLRGHPVELVGASVEVTGPILAVHPDISSDYALKHRGLDVQVVGETSKDLIRHLEAMTQVSA